MRLTRCRSAGRNATVFTYLCSEPLHKRSRVQIEQRSGRSHRCSDIRIHRVGTETRVRQPFSSIRKFARPRKCYKTGPKLL